MRHGPLATRRMLLIGAAAAAAALPVRLRAQTAYPSRPLRIVVPLPPGPSGDIITRLISEKLSARLGQPVRVDNLPGDGSNRGAVEVAKAPPDGYTLLATPQAPLAINGHLHSEIGFDPRAFVPITVLAAVPSVLVARAEAPFETFAELIEYARANPRRLTCATGGTGTSHHLASVMLEAAAGIRLVHMPLGAMATARLELLSGNVDVMFDNLADTLPAIRERKLKLLAVTTEKRAKAFSGIPAISEFYPAVLYTSWLALVAPPGISPEIVAKLHTSIAQVMRLTDVTRRLDAMGVIPGGMSPAETASLIKDESARWGRVVRMSGILIQH